MKVLLVHNAYGTFSGEEASVKNISGLLGHYGHDVIHYFRSSEEISQMPFGKVKAFFSGIYNRSTRKTIRTCIENARPDIVHVHNLFPLISPSILIECRRMNIPVVMTVHNYRLICPNGLHVSHGTVCERCTGGKEYWCTLRNCENELYKSIGYALRNYWARKRRMFLDNVSRYICVTHFQARKLTAAGFPGDRIDVFPYMVQMNGDMSDSGGGHYVDFIGRVSPEKGIATLIKAANKCFDIPFRVTGSDTRFPQFKNGASSNMQFLGTLSQERIASLYNTSRIVVFPSIWFEGCPMVLLEAMMQGKTIICSRIGGLPEIVDENITGLLFEPGNASELAEKIRYLWERPDLCQAMGKAGKEKALREYSPEKYYQSLIAVYKKAIAIN